MNILFFDMEFANGKIPGSVYSFGYVRTNGKFKLTEPQTDLLINPECEWNEYVKHRILAYPMHLVKEATPFPGYYKRICKLLRRADLIVGFAVSNDTAALRKDCARYGLKPPVFPCLDLERVCKKLPQHRDARGLSGCVKAWCRFVPENQHRSDGDAYATMLLLKAVCEQTGIKPKELKKKFSDCMIASIPPQSASDEEEQAAKQKPAAPKPDRPYYYHRKRNRKPNVEKE